MTEPTNLPSKISESDENEEYIYKQHPYLIRYQPKTVLQAILFSSNRLVTSTLFSLHLHKCVYENQEVYEKETADKVPLEKQTFKYYAEVDGYCLKESNIFIRKHFAKSEWEMFDCFDECERIYPKDYFKYLDFYIIKRIPCRRQCEYEYNEKARPVCEKLKDFIKEKDFRVSKEKLENIG